MRLDRGLKKYITGEVARQAVPGSSPANPLPAATFTDLPPSGPATGAYYWVSSSVHNNNEGSLYFLINNKILWLPTVEVSRT